MQAANTAACGDPIGSSSPDENSPETIDVPDSSSLNVPVVSPHLDEPEASEAAEGPSRDSELDRREVWIPNPEQNEEKDGKVGKVEDEATQATFETVTLEDVTNVTINDENHESRESPDQNPEPIESELVDRPIPAVQICVRLRPMLQWERCEAYEPSTMELKEGIDGTVALKEDGRHRHFRFNTVIGADRSQQEVWDMSRIDSVVNKVALGFHATIFAYGQTGTGKTHTMEGFTYEHHCGTIPTISAARPRVKAKATPADQLGIVPRAVMALFERVEAMRLKAEKAMEKSEASTSLPSAAPTNAVVRLSFLQIYNEKIFDLLNPAITVSQREAGGRGDEFAGLRLRWDAGKRHFFVENLFQYECSSPEEALQHYQQGIQNKQVASTTMNVASSRSHTLLVLTLLRREGEGNESTESSRPCREVISQLSLVDLAGSERSSRELREGKSSTRFHEAVNVNQSLFVLRRVITALSKRETSKSDVVHVPYRESKLTSLLQNSLGGNSYLVMFACLAPSEKQDDENLSTLQYASQAACIRNQPVVNLDPKDQLIQQLEARLAVAHDYLRRALQVSELPEDLLEQENRAAEAAGGGRRRPRPPRTQPSNTPRKLKSHRQTAQTTQTAQTDGSSALRLGQISRAKTWTGTEQRWGFQEDQEDSEAKGAKGANAKITEVMGSHGSESSRESSKSRAKNLKKPPGYDRSDKVEAATATLSRIVQGAAQKSPNSEDWPFAMRSKKSETPEGQELFAAVDAMMRGYDGRPKASPRKPKPRPASLPPVVPESSPAKPKAGRESPASVQSAETALDSMAGSKCSCCGSDRIPQTDAVDTEKNSEVMEELQKARELQRRLEEELLTAHGKIQDLEVKQAQQAQQFQQSKLSEDAKVAEVTQDLRSENAELHKRLEVFYKAMEFEADGQEPQEPAEEQTPATAASPEAGSASIGPKIEKFHSQLVLEAVTLRNEVAQLKKKKWIIKAVLDNGGEHERQAIVEEVAQLRSKRDANTSATS